ncbi:glycosyltransferase [Brachybacterium sp. MASK1Z-5]|uniref:D-inositol 3-phosphate glycosyltransferase n=1 Tax=Brachybacterium halotolerans TaxID=2795215 RepID=A0ABS1B7M5_9MICO|nr:glycosyltransferase [Brachybacterium halotolerans]MBK0330662.1 glycosyltransferase [Brachybacterium halotolerans]
MTLLERSSSARHAVRSERPLKVLLTTDWWEPAVNGVVASVTTLRRQLEALGCDVRVLTLAPGLRSSCEGKVYRLGSVSASLFYASARIGTIHQRRILGAIKRWHPDVVHSNCEFTTHVWARRIARDLDVPLVHTYHTIYEDYTHYYSPSRTMGRKAVAEFSRRLLERTDAVIAPTEKVAHLLEGYRVSRPVHVIPTGLDLGRFRPAQSSAEAADSAALRASLGIGARQKVLLSVSRLAKEKNLDQVIRDVAAAEREDAVLVLVGDGPYREHLEHLVADLGMERSVRFAGAIDPHEVPRWYRMADLFVSASRSETQGLTYIEALACGLPLLCRRDDSVAGVLVAGETGYAVEDSAEFCARLTSLLDDEIGIERMSHRALQHARRTCGAEAFGARVLEVYRTMHIERSRGAAPSAVSAASSSATGLAPGFGAHLAEAPSGVPAAAVPTPAAQGGPHGAPSRLLNA